MSTENQESEGLQDTGDGDPGNMLVRAGYLQGLAMKLDGEDREMLRRASRSLQYAANHLERFWLLLEQEKQAEK